MMITVLEGIVIAGSYEYDDYDVITTIFSKQLGKLSFYARGVKKPISKNKYALNLFTYGEYELFLSPTKLSKLKTAKLITSYLNLANDYESYLWAQYCCNIIDIAFQTREKNSNAFELLLSLLTQLNTNNNLLFLIRFLLTSLEWYGLQLNLQECVECHTHQRLKTISLTDGGYLCANCVTKFNFIIPANILRLLDNTMKLPLSALPNLFINPLGYEHLCSFLQYIFKTYEDLTGIYNLVSAELNKISVWLKK